VAESGESELAVTSRDGRVTSAVPLSQESTIRARSRTNWPRTMDS